MPCTHPTSLSPGADIPERKVSGAVDHDDWWSTKSSAELYYFSDEMIEAVTGRDLDIVRHHVGNPRFSILSRNQMMLNRHVVSEWWGPCKRGDSVCSQLQSKPGKLQSISALILMTIMHTARVARYDPLQPVSFLAKYIAKWDAACDRRLHRLMCYIYGTQDGTMVGWVGDDPADITGHLWCDTDFAGDPYTLKSTSGCHLDLQGPNTRFPIMGMCGGQTCEAQSSTEAEVPSLNTGLKTRGEGALSMLEVILAPHHRRV